MPASCSAEILNANTKIAASYPMTLTPKSVCYGLAAAGNESAMRPPLPPLGCGGEWKETGRNRWVGIRAV